LSDGSRRRHVCFLRVIRSFGKRRTGGNMKGTTAGFGRKGGTEHRGLFDDFGVVDRGMEDVE
jgi:hypothetical protein